MICGELSLECDRVVLFVYELFISKSKFPVYGILHDAFFKRRIKGHRHSLSALFSMYIVSFLHQ